jgi:hypothetical protein
MKFWVILNPQAMLLLVAVRSFLKHVYTLTEVFAVFVLLKFNRSGAVSHTAARTLAK